MNSKWCCIDWHKKASENTKNKLSNNFQFVSIVMHWKTRVQFTVKQLNIDEWGTKICCYYLLQTNFLTFCPRVDSKNISTSLIATLFLPFRCSSLEIAIAFQRIKLFARESLQELETSKWEWNWKKLLLHRSATSRCWRALIHFCRFRTH